MKKVIITKGLPGSGKSTWAKELQRRHPQAYKRINKDELRAMLDDGYHSPQNEAFVVEVRNLLIGRALAAGKHVIVDDTNLNPVHEADIRALVGQSAQVEVKDFTDVDVETCVARDLQRLHSVGERVIRQMHARYLAPPPPSPLALRSGLPTVVLCDLDGTLALRHGRPSEQDALLHQPVADLLQGRSAILISERDEAHRAPTEAWLQQHGVAYEALYLRRRGDRRPEALVKGELYERHIRPHFNVAFVLEDRDQAVAMWRALGLTCLQVGPGHV